MADASAKPAREQGEGSENWMARSFQAGASIEEVADVLALSVLLDRPCEEIKNVIVDAQVRARFGARAHVRRFGRDLKRLAGDPPGHTEVLVVPEKSEQTMKPVDNQKLLPNETQDGEL